MAHSHRISDQDHTDSEGIIRLLSLTTVVDEPTFDTFDALIMDTV